MTAEYSYPASIKSESMKLPDGVVRTLDTDKVLPLGRAPHMATRRTIPPAVVDSRRQQARETSKLTKQQNIESAIDFATPRDSGSFRSGRQSPWVLKVHELVNGVLEGKGEYDKFYLLGKFTAVSGARTTIRNLAKHESELPLVPVTFEVEVVPGDGSELWAAVRWTAGDGTQ